MTSTLLTARFLFDSLLRAHEYSWEFTSATQAADRVLRRSGFKSSQQLALGLLTKQNQT